MTTETTAAEQELGDLLDQWSAGIADRRPETVAALFTEDALFQGFDPEPGYGRDYISSYYAKQPVGMKADFELLSVRAPGGGALVGYARVLFSRPDGDVTVYMTVIAQRSGNALLLSHYHVSKLVSD